MRTDDERTHNTLAKLDDGSIVPYDAAGKSEYTYEKYPAFQYIGAGVIYSVNGVLQTPSEEKVHFFIRKS